MDGGRSADRIPQRDRPRTALDQFAVEAARRLPSVSDSPSFRPPRRRMMLGAVICVSAVGVGSLLWSHATATETGSGFLTVESEPRGAAVFVDGKPSGMTPISLAVAAGTHRLVLQRGQRSQELSVTVPANVST